MRRVLRGSFATLALCWTGECGAQRPPDWSSVTLSGDWGGTRTRMSERGATLDLLYTGDTFANVSGGISRGTKVMGHLDARFELDLGRFAGWSDATAVFHVISDHGDGINARHVGSFMGVDSIEVDANTTKIYQAWVEQRSPGGALGMLAGLYAVDTEFKLTESSDVFVHPAFGTAPELAQSGRNGPSIFPTTSVGARIRYHPNPAVYAQVALLDGVPGDPNNPHGTHVQLNRGDGTFLIAEVGFRPTQIDSTLAPARTRRGAALPREHQQEPRLRPVSKVALGYWRYSARLDDLTEVNGAGNPLRRRSHGAYLLAEETLYQESQDGQRGLVAFLGYGVAEPNVNRVDYSLYAGVRYKGPLPGRGNDELGLGFARAHSSAKYGQVLLIETGEPAAAAETAVELTYRMPLRPWLALQPVIQRVARPGFSTSSNTAWVAGLRAEVAF